MLVEKAKYKFNEASIEAIQRRIDQNPHFKESGIIGIHAVHHELIWEMKNELSTAIESGCENKKSFKKVKKHIDNNVNYLLNQLSKWATANALNDLNINPPLDYLAHYPRHTEYYEQALKLDKKRSKPYWATVRELFARAGAAYVQDKLDSKAQRSDYLVYGADEARYTDHPVGNPNPVSPDRKEFYKLYEGLFDQYRLRYVDELEKNTEAEIKFI